MLSRRDVMGGMLLAASAGSNLSAEDASEFMVRIRADEHVLNAGIPAIEQSSLKISKDDSEDAKELISKAPKEKAVPLLLIIVGSIAAVNLAKMVIELVREHYYGGVVIDTRVKPPLITNDLKIPAGMVVVVHENGTQATFKETDISPGFFSKILAAFK